ncbi:MAG: GNAT family N-acetyltransferase [Proteobacteria bacterium]|nr:GNAT family N-acetyltransferase [Pseudomonadota bacterium]
MRYHDLVLEPARRGDAPVLAAMSRDLIEAGLGWEYREDRLARLIASADHVAIVARERRGVAGFAVMQFGDEHAHLVLLAVQPDRQRQGIAVRLAGWLLQSALVAGSASIHVELREANVAARALYERLGFAETMRLDGYYRGRETAVRMIRVLRPPGATPPAWIPPPRSDARH